MALMVSAAAQDTILCCQAMTVACMSCAQNQSPEEFCSAPPAGFELECRKLFGPGPKRCCRAMTVACMSCAANKTPEEYCADPPANMIDQCTAYSPVQHSTKSLKQTPGPKRCCRAMTVACMSCAANKTPEEYCADPPANMIDQCTAFLPGERTVRVNAHLSSSKGSAPVQFLTVARRKATKVTLVWAQPNGVHHCNDYKYTVEYRRKGSDQWVTVQAGISQTFVTIERLEPFSKYVARVSSFSEQIDISTAEIKFRTKKMRGVQ